jgi:hypothetical protein
VRPYTSKGSSLEIADKRSTTSITFTLEGGQERQRPQYAKAEFLAPLACQIFDHLDKLLMDLGNIIELCLDRVKVIDGRLYHRREWYGILWRSLDCNHCGEVNPPLLTVSHVTRRRKITSWE